MNLLPKKPFHEHHEFIGRIVQGDQVSDNLQCIVTNSQIHNGPINGYIIGNADTVKRIQKVTNLKLAPPFLESQSDDISREKFKSDEFLWKRISLPSYSDSFDRFSIVCEFILQSYSTITKHEPIELNKRIITFLLTGPLSAWHVVVMRERSFSGEVKINAHHSQLDLVLNDPFNIEVIPRYFYSDSNIDGKQEVSTDVLTIQITTEQSSDELTDQDFIEKSKQLVDDILLLMSLVSRRWIAWYAYYLETKTEILDYYRTTRSCSGESLSHDATLVNAPQIRQFLKESYSRYQRLRDEGFSLKLPLLYYISANEATYTEEQFTGYFLALEKLRDLFIRSRPHLQHTLKPDEFISLAESIHQTIKQEVKLPDARRLLYAKLSDLNRPPLSSVLNEMFLFYKVDWHDLYPANSIFTLIQTRDKMFHSSMDLDHETIFHETERLKAIVERFLLAILEFPRFSNAPLPYVKQELVELQHKSQ